MQIPRSWILRYSRSIRGISKQARETLADALEQVDWTQDVATIRSQVIAIMQACCGASSTMAARIAADFYDGLRAEFGIEDGFSAIANSLRDSMATDGAVRAFAQDLVDGKRDSFVEKCLGRIESEVLIAANKCVRENAKRDPKKPRYARVPTGAETCEFCIMLASRGFVYASHDLASHAHANCDCRVVPSWDKKKAAVEGYDPDYYLDCYQHPNDHPEIRDAINARRRELYALAHDEADNGTTSEQS